MLKSEARKLAREKLKRLTKAEKEWASGAIVDALSGIDEFRYSKKPFIYLSHESEVDTEELIGLALMLEKDVSVPKLVGKDMKAICITPYSLFKKNAYGILEPRSGHEATAVDVAVVPMLAYDGLMRVGHGGGYYDRFLNCRDVFKLGVAFDCQKCDGVEFEAFDVPLDMLVTEKNIFEYCEGKIISRPNEFFVNGGSDEQNDI